MTANPKTLRHHNETIDGDTVEGGLAEYNADVLAQQPALVEAFLAMLEGVPDPDDDAAANIIGTIFAAESAADLNKPWESDGMADFWDQPLTVKSITKRPSDFTGGLGVYLGCQCIVHASGEEMFITCGGVSAVAQLVKAHAMGLFPLVVIPTRARKATAKGFWPYHLIVERKAVEPSNVEQAS